MVSGPPMMCRHLAECGVMLMFPGEDYVINATQTLNEMCLCISGEVTIKKSCNVKQFKNSMFRECAEMLIWPVSWYDRPVSVNKQVSKVLCLIN